MAKVIKDFLGVKDGDVYPTEFKVDDDVQGELATLAIKEKWAVADRATKSIEAAPENK